MSIDQKKHPSDPAPTANDIEFIDCDANCPTECTGMIPAKPETPDALENYNEVISFLPPDPPKKESKS